MALPEIDFILRITDNADETLNVQFDRIPSGDPITSAQFASNPSGLTFSDITTDGVKTAQASISGPIGVFDVYVLATTLNGKDYENHGRVVVLDSPITSFT